MNREPAVQDVRFRLARASDAETVAAVHADSWRRHYRGAYSDAFLDGDVLEDRRAVWRERLARPGERTQTVVAEGADGSLIGFAHTVFEEDARWGALLDNLHVVHASKRRGIGSQLLSVTGRAVADHGTGLYLWVLEQNIAAQAFYEASGAACVGRGVAGPPGGIPTRLNGAPGKLRYAWSDPTALIL